MNVFECHDHRTPSRGAQDQLVERAEGLRTSRLRPQRAPGQSKNVEQRVGPRAVDVVVLEGGPNLAARLRRIIVSVDPAPFAGQMQ
jgi:hypothetical protein